MLLICDDENDDCFQRKEPVGDSDALPQNIVDALEVITPDMLEVNFHFQVFTLGKDNFLSLGVIPD